MVLDVNIFLDVADLVGEPFSWSKFRAAVAAARNLPVPALDERVDSLRVIAHCLSGQVIDGEPLEVWTSKHIDDLVAHKASQPTNAATPELTGLGWSKANAVDLVKTLVWDLVEGTYGYTVNELLGHEWHPPLSHEDGYVYQSAYKAGDDELSLRYCITRDVGFRGATLPPRVSVLHPDEFILMLRNARRPPPGSGPASLMRR